MIANTFKVSVVCIAMAFSTAPSAQIHYPEAQCENIEGNYWRYSDNLRIKIIQKDCNISGEFESQSREFYHKIEGQWLLDEKCFSTKITRIARASKKNNRLQCKTVMDATIKKFWNNNLLITVIGTDGRCDLPKDYMDGKLWVRQKN